ncbi:MAG: VWA domain-containing protein [Planctomycetia bacterium]|nr:VWA domain-containing protein [Planctomycetia bacterium]
MRSEHGETVDLIPPEPLDWRVSGWHGPSVLSLVVHLGLIGVCALVAGRRQAIQDNALPEGWDNVAARGLDVRFIDILDEPAPSERTIATSNVPAIAHDSEPAAPVVEPRSAPVVQAAHTGTLPAPLSSGAAEASPPAPDNGTAGGTGAASPLFPVPAEARSVVYVLDSSGSMGQQGRLALAEQEVLRSVGRLSAAVRFQIIAYNRQLKFLAGSGGLLPAEFDRLHEVKGRLSQLTPEGGTDHFRALRQALLLRPEVIFFLTDADDLKPEDVRALTQLNQGKTAIHVVELNLANRDREDLPMHRLARENRGKYRAVEMGR